MSPSNSWLPVWLEVVATVAFVIIAVVHLWHLRDRNAEVRLWHASHVLMALGMIDMFWPASPMPVAGNTGRVVFGLAALGALGVAAAAMARGLPGRSLWVLTMVDLGAMAYMFAMPLPPLSGLTWIFAAWFGVQAVGWVSSRLTPMGCAEQSADLSAAPASAAELPAGSTAVVPDASGATVRVADASGHEVRDRHEFTVRVTLFVMNVGMAYMFLAMQLGMGHAGGSPMMPDMPAMSGM